MALMAYMKVTGSRQATINGGAPEKGKEGLMGVIAISHEIDSARDPQSGMATGKRQHKPLVIVKELDVATPRLLTSLVSNETLTLVHLDVYMATGAGQPPTKPTFSIDLENASLASQRLISPDIRTADGAKRAAYEELSFVYQKITWTWTAGGITASDDWMDRG